jgi:hypothetical protein
MSQLWIGPVLLTLLCVVWFAVQRAWIWCMGQPADRDALQRPGYCGTACACRADCPRRRKSATAASKERGDLKS